MTQCACYSNMNTNNNRLSFVVASSNPLLFDNSITLNEFLTEFIDYNNTEYCISSIIFVGIFWLFTLFCYCFAPIHDDIPLISKNVIIPSHFRYRMFTLQKKVESMIYYDIQI